MYFTGDLGAVEIVGDSCVGGADPHADDGTNEFATREHLGFPRTQQLGELVGSATVQALRGGEPLDVADINVVRADYHIAGSNAMFAFANTISLLDLDPTLFDVKNCPAGTGICPPVEQYSLTFINQTGQPLAQLIV